MARSSNVLDLSMESWNMAVVARARVVARESISILTQTVRPDTFLGRKTQEPFPPEQEKKIKQLI
jgi:hypothetical protein